MMISLKKDRACNRVLREVPSEVKRKLNLDLEEVCVTLGKSFGSLKTWFPCFGRSGME